MLGSVHILSNVENRDLWPPPPMERLFLSIPLFCSKRIMQIVKYLDPPKALRNTWTLPNQSFLNIWTVHIFYSYPMVKKSLKNNFVTELKLAPPFLNEDLIWRFQLDGCNPRAVKLKLIFTLSCSFHFPEDSRGRSASNNALLLYEIHDWDCSAMRMNKVKSD